MGYYAIGIGGTGAKCLESLIHLAAAGMIPDGELYVLFVDPDTQNGSLDRAQQTLGHYMECKNTLQLGNNDLLKTKIVSANSNLWTPFEDRSQPSLDKFFKHNSLHTSTDKSRVAAAHLLEMLYSKTERKTTLEQGFRGHPSIGAAVMAQTVNLGKNEPWRTFCQRLENDPDPKVFLAGSIFGGTGASGFPTIARLVKEALVKNDKDESKNENQRKMKLGGALVLPYFYFIFPKSPDENDNPLKAESQAFLMNTQAALKYYHLWNQTDIYNAVYLFGAESLTEVDPSLGGKEQRNAPHFIELYAALAALDFFEKDFEDDESTQYFMITRRQNDQLRWEDLPDGNNGNRVRTRIGQLARFAFSYLSVYRPVIQDIYTNGNSYRAPWFIDFFTRNNIQYNQTLLDSVKRYCEDFLLWIANLQENRGETEKIELVEYDTYTQRSESNRLELIANNNFTASGFSNLIQSQGEANPDALDELWEDMCDDKAKDRDGEGIGKFLCSLYENCAD